MSFEQGFDEEIKEETATPEKVVKLENVRKPFVPFEVGGREYRLKLTTSAIVKLEDKYNQNLLILITDEGLPPLSVMLTVIQAAMQKFEHGVTFRAVQDIYDTYVEEGGDQTKLMSDVLMPLLGNAGFFTENQTREMQAAIQEMDSEI